MKRIIFFFLLLSCVSGINAQQSGKGEYRCTPCGSNCDKAVHRSKGNCPDCGMPLVPASTISLTEIAPDSICAYLATHPQTLLLDVRTKAEFDGKADPDYGTLKGAINIPIQDLPRRIRELERYKGREILVFCSHSHRSPRAAYLLQQQGFRQVVNMSGGMSAVKENGCKTYRDQ